MAGLKDSAENCLGLLGYVFASTEEQADHMFFKCPRSFFDGINVSGDKLTVYFRSAGWGDDEFFAALCQFSDYIENIRITADEEDEDSVDEYGENFEILIQKGE